MSRFQLVRDPSGNPEVERLYQEMVASGFGAAGVPLHWFTSQATRPDILAGTWALVRSVLVQGQLPPTLKELIAMTISVQNSCRYCAVTHSGVLEALGVDRSVVERAAQDPTLADFPPAYRAAVTFALKAARAPNAMTDEDYDALRAAGYGDGEILEIVMMAAFTRFINTWADAIGLSPDTAG